MTKSEAIDYLEHVLEDWNDWRKYHEPLCKAIEILLEDVKENEDRNN